jgi:TonB family protein
MTQQLKLRWLTLAILSYLNAAFLHAEIPIEQFQGTFSVNPSINPDSDEPMPIPDSIIFSKSTDDKKYFIYALNMYFRIMPQQEYVINAVTVQKHLPEKPKSNDYKRLVLAAWPEVDSKDLKTAAKNIEAWVKRSPEEKLLLLSSLMKVQDIKFPTRPGSHVQESKLIRKVEPVYPQEALKNRISGIVKLEVWIDERGLVVMIKPIDGSHHFIPAALAAVQQWQYSPTLLDGQPVMVIATVTVKFKVL